MECSTGDFFTHFHGSLGNQIIYFWYVAAIARRPRIEVQNGNAK